MKKRTAGCMIKSTQENGISNYLIFAFCSYSSVTAPFFTQIMNYYVLVWILQRNRSNLICIERFIIKIILFHFSQFLYILSVHEEPFHHQSMKIFPKVGNDSQQEICLLPLPTGDIFDCHNLGEDTTSIWWVETKEASQHPYFAQTTP